MAASHLDDRHEKGCRRWLAATTDAERADNERWVRELVEQPLTRAVIEELLAE